MDHFLAERAMLLFCPFLKSLIDSIIYVSYLEISHIPPPVNDIQNDFMNCQALLMKPEIPPNLPFLKGGMLISPFVGFVRPYHRTNQYHPIEKMIISLDPLNP
jgi:hypothetical protein